MDTQNGVYTSKVLFLTHAENGQANTVLAMALEALTRPNVEVHIASFPVLKQRVERLSPKLIFHALDDKSMGEVLPSQGLPDDDYPHLPTCKSFAAYGWPLGLILTTWDGECAFRSPPRIWVVSDGVVGGLAYMRICSSIIKLIEELNPGVVVVDTLLYPGFDACYSMNRKFVMNCPTTPLGVARWHQPWLKGFWHYPVFVFPSNPLLNLD